MPNWYCVWCTHWCNYSHSFLFYFNFQAILSIVFERLFDSSIQILIKHEFWSNNKYIQSKDGLVWAVDSGPKMYIFAFDHKTRRKLETFILQVEKLYISEQRRQRWRPRKRKRVTALFSTYHFDYTKHKIWIELLSKWILLPLNF